MTQLERISETIYQELLESAGDSVWAVDEDGRYLFLNDSVARLLELPREHVLNKTYGELHTGEDTNDFLDKIKRVYQGEVVKYEYFGSRSRRWFLRTISPVRDDSGNIVAASILSKDITDLRIIERELRESQERYRNLILQSPCGIITSDMKGVITSVNPEAARLLGFSEDEIIGIHLSQIRIFDALRIQRLGVLLGSKVVDGKTINPIEVSYRHKDGISRWVEIRFGFLQREGKDVALQVMLTDITNRKDVEKDLKESQERYKALFELAPVGLATLDMNGMIMSTNSTALKFSGFSKDEVIGRHFSEMKFFKAEDTPRFLELLRSLLRRGRLKPFEVEYIRADGTAGWAELYPGLIKVDGIRAGIQVAIIDISERKEIERELLTYTDNLEKNVAERTRETRLLSNIAASIEQAVVAVDNNHRIIYVNEAFANVFGYKINEVIGEDYSMLRTNGSNPNEHDQMIEAIKHQRYWSGERLFRRKNDQTFPAGAFVCSLRDERSKTIGRLCLITDKTEQKEMERRLQHQEERLRRTFNHTPIGIILTDAQGNYTEVNEAQCKISKAPREELLKQNYFDQKDKSLLPFFEKAMHGEAAENEGWYTTTARGLTYWVRTVFAPVFGSEGKVSGVIILTEDKTEKKKLEEQLFEQSRLAFIGATAAMVGHDLRNPLQAVVNNLYLMKKRLGSITIPQTEKENLEKTVKSFEEQVQYMNKIVSDLQDYARPVRLELVEMCVKELIDDCLSSIPIPSSVKVSFNMEEGFPRLMLDHTCMKRVFTNLITNAIQAMPQGGKLTITALKTEQNVLIHVQDTGLGIAKENMDKLFQPLFTTKAKGQGLGLAVCNRLVGAHGGEILVESERGKGSTFTVKIPREMEVS